MPYIDLKQASEATGKSIRTVRRLCNDSKSKDYISYEDGKLVVEVSYLAQHYPIKTPSRSGTPTKNDTGHVIAKDSHNDIANGTPSDSKDLLHKIALLEQELKHKDQLAQEKEKQLQEKQRQVDILERSLLMLGEGKRKEPEQPPVSNLQPSITPTEPEPTPTQEPTKKKRWWHF